MHKHLRREKKVFQIVDLSAIIEKKNAVKLSKEVGRSFTLLNDGQPQGVIKFP